jgi:hypothetical protein
MLENLELEEVSLVDKAANQHAQITLFKRDNSEGNDMTDETQEVTKMSDEMDKKIKDYMKAKGCDRKTAEQAMMKSFDEAESVETLKAQNEELRKALIDNGFKITKEGVEKSAPVEYVEVEGEQVNKADIPAPILKRLEAAEIEKREAAVEKAAQEKFPNFKPEVAKEIIKADFADEVLSALMALDNLLEGQMNEIGKSTSETGDMTDPNEKLNALAKKYAEEHQTSFAKGYSEVVKTDAGKALIKDIYKKD